MFLGNGDKKKEERKKRSSRKRGRELRGDGVKRNFDR